jgi:uncharacterized protein (DUF924 family)
MPRLTAEAFLDFWLSHSDKVLYRADPKFDAQLRRRFRKTLEAARSGALDSWAETPEGALALVIILDQLSRNLHRGTPEMYGSDAKALSIAKQAIAKGFDRKFRKLKRRWFYMPFMHSENLADQERCIELCRESDIRRTLPYAENHAEVVRRFGRFPHRNKILGRPSTEAELAFLAAGGFAG